MSLNPCWAFQISACFSSIPAGGVRLGLFETPPPPETITLASDRLAPASPAEYDSTVVGISASLKTAGTLVSVPVREASGTGLTKARPRSVTSWGRVRQVTLESSLPHKMG